MKCTIAGILFDPGWVQGIGSLLAVIVAMYIALQQQSYDRKTKSEALARQHLSSRAMLVFALNKMRAYADESMSRTAEPLYSEFEGSVTISPSWERPALPETSLRDIGACAASCASSEAGSPFSELLRFAQIQNARLSRLEERRGGHLSDLEVAGYLFDAARLAALTDALFEYGRFETDSPKGGTDSDRIEKVLSLKYYERNDPVFRQTYAIIDRTRPAQSRQLFMRARPSLPNSH